MRARKGFREIDSPNNDTFGVFQDSLGREVALAREERSTGDGHDEFEIEPVSPMVEAGEPQAARLHGQCHGPRRTLGRRSRPTRWVHGLAEWSN